MHEINLICKEVCDYENDFTAEEETEKHGTRFPQENEHKER